MSTKNINHVEFLVKSSIVAAIYAALTMLLPFSYLGVQFRIAEILVLLVFIDKRYIYGLTLGCLIANLGSPLGPVDVIFGTLATLIALLLISKTKNLFVATLWPAVVNGIIIGLLLYYMLDLPFLLSAAQVFFGEFVVVTLIGYFLFKRILRDRKLVEIITFN
ncbi:QueT transporter family protein [Proteiniclasticum sp. C24MP]|uniref:QueT transporter family protein n=1 Tax=Proteiniclasticum sp. C24MP TaxID=3374101 RepID=UPI003754BE3A